MIQPNAIERVEESQATLNLMGLDHRFENLMNGNRLTLTSEMIGNSQDGTEVVGWMSPYNE